MKRIFISLCMMALGAALTLESAEAARLGGGRSMGAQRAAPMQRQMQPAAPTAPQAAKPAAPAQTPQPAPQGNRWLGPIAGLAAGLGLGWLFAHGGFGGFGGGLVMMLLIAFAVVMVMRLLARRAAESSQPAHQYAGMGNETVAAPPPSQLPSADTASQPDFGSQFRPQIPAGFDVEGFLRQAKLNFVRMQQANDKGDLDTIKEVTTAEMFEVLRDDFAGRAGELAQQTDVVTLDATLLEVITEGDMHWASVRFAGSIRETPSAVPAAFEEVWNLQKPVNGRTGWLLAGIQQVS
jgi:predicted lipid-binding transport protein (Tim44 family)